MLRCERCVRLRQHCRQVAEVKRRAYRERTYWGRPVPGFGDPKARLALVGLAPGAHGANRTGRMFTGDRSGEFLYAALHRAGLARLPTAVSADDGQELRGVFITAAARCAPPDNRPNPDELRRCAPFLARELELLRELRAVIALGRIAWDALFRRAVEIDASAIPVPRPRFGHGASVVVRLREGPAVALLGAYHPSQQNTQTGRLTAAMFDDLLIEGCRRAGLGQSRHVECRQRS